MELFFNPLDKLCILLGISFTVWFTLLLVFIIVPAILGVSFGIRRLYMKSLLKVFEVMDPLCAATEAIEVERWFAASGCLKSLPRGGGRILPFPDILLLHRLFAQGDASSPFQTVEDDPKDGLRCPVWPGVCLGSSARGLFTAGGCSFNSGVLVTREAPLVSRATPREALQTLGLLNLSHTRLFSFCLHNQREQTL